MVVYLSGGVGGAKLALGLSKVLAPGELTFVVNTGDDIELLGLRICPDIDTVIYTLAGQVNPATGWGLADTRNCLEQLRRLGEDTWFQLGDRDLATHLWRTAQLRAGCSLSAVTQTLAQKFGLAFRVLPAVEGFAPTYIHSDGAALHLQEYFVREQCRPRVDRLEYRNADGARPGVGVLEALRAARLIVIGPSNPLISIAPILAVPQIRAAIQARTCPAVAVSPIVGGKALKGPADKMLAELGFEASASGVARFYGDLVDVFVIDEIDAARQAEIESRGVKTRVMKTIMTTLEDKVRLAREVLEIL